MSTITVCLTNWARPDNLKKIIDLISSQKIKTSIFLWNNGNDFYHPNIDWVIHSSVNKICGPRWYMASNADTEYVCILDDDLFFTDDEILSDIVKIAENMSDSTILGPTGVKLVKDKGYAESEHLYSFKVETSINISCDIIKGSMMFLRTKSLKEKIKLNIFEYYRDEDIVVSAMLADGNLNRHLCLTSFGRRFYSLGNDEHALWRKEGHMEARNDTCKKFFNFF